MLYRCISVDTDQQISDEKLKGQIGRRIKP